MWRTVLALPSLHFPESSSWPVDNNLNKDIRVKLLTPSTDCPSFIDLTSNINEIMAAENVSDESAQSWHLRKKSVATMFASCHQVSRYHFETLRAMSLFSLRIPPLRFQITSIGLEEGCCCCIGSRLTVYLGVRWVMATQRKVAERFCPIDRFRKRKSLEASLVLPQAWITSGQSISCLLSTVSACEVSRQLGQESDHWLTWYVTMSVLFKSQRSLRVVCLLVCSV